jgi:hypothetical protein
VLQSHTAVIDGVALTVVIFAERMSLLQNYLPLLVARFRSVGMARSTGVCDEDCNGRITTSVVSQLKM